MPRTLNYKVQSYSVITSWNYILCRYIRCCSNQRI